jgi:uncharacterized protein with PQ loop repeat
MNRALQTFGDCVSTRLQILGFGIGFISLVLWLVPLFPQLLQNYQRKRCDGLALQFMIFWSALSFPFLPRACRISLRNCIDCNALSYLCDSVCCSGWWATRAICSALGSRIRRSSRNSSAFTTSCRIGCSCPSTSTIRRSIPRKWVAYQLAFLGDFIF